MLKVRAYACSRRRPKQRCWKELGAPPGLTWFPPYTGFTAECNSAQRLHSPHCSSAPGRKRLPALPEREGISAEGILPALLRPTPGGAALRQRTPGQELACRGPSRRRSCGGRRGRAAFCRHNRELRSASTPPAAGAAGGGAGRCCCCCCCEPCWAGAAEERGGGGGGKEAAARFPGCAPACGCTAGARRFYLKKKIESGCQCWILAAEDGVRCDLKSDFKKCKTTLSHRRKTALRWPICWFWEQMVNNSFSQLTPNYA
ncbi:unnamed protein product [Lepidochelys olivacea]